MSTSRRNIVVPDAEEDAAINRGIAEDPDTWEPTDEEWGRSKPISEIDPDFFQGSAAGDFAVVIRQGDAADAPEIRRVRIARSRGGLWIVEADGDVTARETFKDEAAARDRARSLMSIPTGSGGKPADETGPLKPRRISAA